MHRPDSDKLEADKGRLRFLLDEIEAWTARGTIDGPTRDILVQPYAQQFAAIVDLQSQGEMSIERPVPPQCHDSGHFSLQSPPKFCPDCGAEVEVAERLQTENQVTDNSGATDANAVEKAPSLEGQDAEATVAELPAGTGGSAFVPETPVAGTVPVVAVESEVLALHTDAPAVAREPEAGTAPASAEPEPRPSSTTTAPPVEATKPPPRGRFIRELRPVFYENLVLFLGAFLVFAGSVYFGIYFWDRLGNFGPLVAGGLLSMYSFGFSGAGYLLQRRYHADLSARVLYSIATAILPIAVTLIGAPLSERSWTLALGGVCGVAVLAAAAYPMLFLAASLFQREIGRPFARAFAILLIATGLAPLMVRLGVRPAALIYLYLAAVPLIGMYRHVRNVGRVFERATVVFLVGGSAYALIAVAVRLALVLDPTLTLAEVAPLVVLLAALAIDLDVEWRSRSAAVRDDLGVVGVLAHSTAVLAVFMAIGQPVWRVLATLATGILFAVSALRYRRALVLYLATFAFIAGVAMIAWHPALEPPHGVPYSGLLLVPLIAGWARLGARWRKNAAIEYAVPCERSVIIGTIASGLGAFATPLIDGGWSAWSFVNWRWYVPSAVVLPVYAATLVLAWAWGRRRVYLTLAAVSVGATILVTARMAGAEGLGLASAAAASAVMVAVCALRWPGSKSQEAQRALIDGALVLVLAAAAILLLTRVGPWHGENAFATALALLSVAFATILVIANRPFSSEAEFRRLGMLATVAVTAACGSALWPLVPFDRLPILPVILSLGLLVLDRMVAQKRFGQAQPFRDAYVLALVMLAGQICHLLGTADIIAGSSAPIEALLICAALFAVAGRHRTPWPVHAAIVFFTLAGYVAPIAWDIEISSMSCVRWSVGVLIVVALLLRTYRPLDSWRTTFLDPPLDLAALVVPISLVLAALHYATWSQDGYPATLLLLRRDLGLVAISVLAAITHRSILHGYVAAAGFVALAPATVAATGLPPTYVACSLAVTALCVWFVGQTIARSNFSARPVNRSGWPLRLLTIWRLPSAPTLGELWTRPIEHVATLAVVCATGLGIGHTVLVWPDGSVPAALAYALTVLYFVVASVRPLGQARVWAPWKHLLAHGACAAFALLCLECFRLIGFPPRSTAFAVVGLAYYFIGDGLSRRRVEAASATRAPTEWAIGTLVLSVVLWGIGIFALDWHWDPQTLALGSVLCLLLLRPYGHVASIHGGIALGGAAVYLWAVGPTWSPVTLLLIANGWAAIGWVLPPVQNRLNKWADKDLPELRSYCHGWLRATARIVAVIFAALCLNTLFETFQWLGRVSTISAMVGFATTIHLLWARREIRDWALTAVGSAGAAYAFGAPHRDSLGLAFLGLAFAWHMFGRISQRVPWLRVDRPSISVTSLAASLMLCLYVVVLTKANPNELNAPLACALAAIVIVSRNRTHPSIALRIAASLAAMSAAGMSVLFVLGIPGWLDPIGAALCALALTASTGALAHAFIARRTQSDLHVLATVWATVGCLLAVTSPLFALPQSASLFLFGSLSITALITATGWFGYAALRTGRDRYGYAAQVGLLGIYVYLRLSPVLSGLGSQADAITAVGFAFFLQFSAQVLQRAAIGSLGRPAQFGAHLFPGMACVVVSWGVVSGNSILPTFQNALLSGTICILYTIGFYRGGHRLLGLLATVFFNFGLALVWIRTSQQDLLFYTIPVGASIIVLARIYRSNLSQQGRRGMRSLGALLIYFSTYYQVVQFDNGVYPLILGVLALGGLTLGFYLQIRDLFLLSAGFIVLDVVSNLAYYGIHRPVLGWTILTLTGLSLTASGVLFQLHRTKVQSFLSSARARLLSSGRWIGVIRV